MPQSLVPKSFLVKDRFLDYMYTLNIETNLAN